MTSPRLRRLCAFLWAAKTSIATKSTPTEKCLRANDAVARLLQKCYATRLIGWRLGKKIENTVPVVRTNSRPDSRPHTNAPVLNASLGKIERMPGDGKGAYKTHTYRDLCRRPAFAQSS